MVKDPLNKTKVLEGSAKSVIFNFVLIVVVVVSLHII
jgi:hypothetical protein